MLRCLWRAGEAGRRLFPKYAECWIFAGSVWSWRGDEPDRDGVLANQALDELTRPLAVRPVPKDSIRHRRNHSGVT
jgi:hypothetical protein